MTARYSTLGAVIVTLASYSCSSLAQKTCRIATSNLEVIYTYWRDKVTGRKKTNYSCYLVFS